MAELYRGSLNIWHSATFFWSAMQTSMLARLKTLPTVDKNNSPAISSSILSEHLLIVLKTNE